MGPPQAPAGSRFAIDDDPVRAGLAIARTSQRLGELEAAEATLAELYAAHPAHPEVAGTYARLLVMQARYEDARHVASAGGPLGGLRAEAAGLAALHLGDLDAADLAFAVLEVEAATAGHGAAGGHAARLRGMVAHRRGQLGLASDRHREAARRLGEAGERHAAAGAELDLGAVLVERGRASEALPVLASASRVIGELGSALEAGLVELQRSAALLQVGQLDSALAAAESALGRSADAPQLRGRALLAAGDASKRLGDEPAALRGYREALAVAAQRDDARGQLRAHVALAEAGQRDADGLAVDALCTDDEDRDLWTLARGRLALRDPSSLAASADGERPAADGGRRAADGGRRAADGERRAADGERRAVDGERLAPDGERSAVDGGRLAADESGSRRGASTPADQIAMLARACAAIAARAIDEDRVERAFRGHAIAAQLAQRAREPSLARGEAEKARLAHAALSAATAPAYRAVLDGDPDLARLPGEPRAVHDGSRAAPGEAAHLVPAASLRRLLTLSRRLHTEPSLERIFDDVIDAAIELTGAERGCLMVRRLDGALAIAVARNWLADELDGADGAPRWSPSRAIAERAAQTGETVLAVDPALQPRAGAPRIRSVLAVPLRQRGAITGSLYVDHRVRGGAFDAAAAAVLAELADLAAIAIENARRAADLRRAIRETDERNEHLVAELAAHDAELARVTGALAAAEARPAPTLPVVGEELALRPVLAATEQAYIAAAMARAHGNQTAAARLLGLSRFGLQKKLRRQGDPAPDPDDDPA